MFQRAGIRAKHVRFRIEKRTITNLNIKLARLLVVAMVQCDGRANRLNSLFLQEGGHDRDQLSYFGPHFIVRNSLVH